MSQTPQTFSNPIDSKENSNLVDFGGCDIDINSVVLDEESCEMFASDHFFLLSL